MSPNAAAAEAPTASCSLVSPLPAAPPPRPNRTFRAFRHRNYRLYFYGQLVSLTGSWIQTTALTWLAWDHTDQALWAGLVVAAQVLPALLLGPLGGALADRLPKRPLIMATQAGLLAQALGLAAVVACGWLTPWAMLVFAAAAGVVNALDIPARLAFVVDMVGRDDLHNAVALNSLMFNAARVVGPGLGAMLLWIAGPALCFFLNALSFLAVLAALALMDVNGEAPLHPRPLSPEAGESGGRSLRPGWMEGFWFAWRRRDLRRVLVLTAAVGLFAWPILPLLTAVAGRCLDANAHAFGYGLLLCAFGVGAVPSTLLAARCDSAATRRWFLAGGVALAAIGMLGLAASSALPPAMFFCALMGAGLILFNATSQTITQLGADEHNRGRVMAIWSTVICVTSPVGGLVAGWAADWLNVPLVLVLLAVGVATAAGAVFLRGYVGASLSRRQRRAGA
ncbi:MAG TPA: MFS transporter [Gemmataceae bacterium]|nr:MFS transporter [Gemmataceae bacterium]